MQYEDVKRLEQMARDIIHQGKNTCKKEVSNYLSIDGIKLLLAQIPINTEKKDDGI